VTRCFPVVNESDLRDVDELPIVINEADLLGFNHSQRIRNWLYVFVKQRSGNLHRRAKLNWPGIRRQ